MAFDPKALKFIRVYFGFVLWLLGKKEKKDAFISFLVPDGDKWDGFSRTDCGPGDL